MSKEKIFNLFILYDDKERVLFFGHVVYEKEGSDECKLKFLKKRAEVDFRIAKLERAPIGMTLDTVNAHARLAQVYKLFSHVFAEHPVNQPLCCVTPVVNGAIHFNYQTDHVPLDMHDINGKLGNSEMQDWLVRYHIDGNLHLMQLINDDYFEAIKVLFNKGMYVSATKLLVSCIDSLAYVEYGNVRNKVVFILWMDAFADLSPLGITSEELWEHRNGLLHMSNLESNKVERKVVRRISYFVGKTPFGSHMNAGEVHYFNLHQLIMILDKAIVKWLETYNVDPSKFTTFVERYDKVISDARLGRLVWGESEEIPKV